MISTETFVTVQIITYDREKGGTVMLSERGKTTTSSLIITHATQRDSGKYECDPSASYPQSVNVHIIKIGKPGYNRELKNQDR